MPKFMYKLPRGLVNDPNLQSSIASSIQAPFYQSSLMSSAEPIVSKQLLNLIYLQKLRNYLKESALMSNNRPEVFAQSVEHFF